MPTTIEWTWPPGFKGESWNPVKGCTKVSPGCANCYAEVIALRFKRNGPFLPGQAVISTHDEELERPLKWKAPRCIFTCSASDLFHEEVSFAFIDRVFATMALTQQHVYLLLTKRPERMKEYLNELTTPFNIARRMGYQAGGDFITGYKAGWPLPNVIIGTSVENQTWADRRLSDLVSTKAAGRFVSFEPLLRHIDVSAIVQQSPGALDWFIIGGESGAKARPMHPLWVESLLKVAVDNGIAFFFKQWGQWIPFGCMADYENKGIMNKTVLINIHGTRIADRALWSHLPHITDVLMKPNKRKSDYAIFRGWELREFPGVILRRNTGQAQS